MDLSVLTQYLSIVVVGICLCVGFVIKNSLDFIPNKYIPLIMLILGLAINVLMNLNGINASAARRYSLKPRPACGIIHLSENRRVFYAENNQLFGRSRLYSPGDVHLAHRRRYHDIRSAHPQAELRRLYG